MVDLDMDECDHLMDIWRICYKCETTISEKERGCIYVCKCLFHLRCPFPRVREDHSCSLESKQQAITNYVKKTFYTDDVRGAYKIYMEHQFLNLLNESNASNLTKEDCNLLMMCWRICSKCETKVEGTTSHSNTQETEIVTNYVRKTYGTDNVRTAFKTYTEQILPGLEKPDEKTVRIVELVQNTRNLQELTEARQLCEELRRENSELQIENEQLKNEKQQGIERTEQAESEKQNLIQKQKETKDELDRTTGKLAKLSNEIREMKKKWAEVRGESCADFQEEESDEDVFEESDECLFDYEWENFKIHFKELEKKISDLWQRSIASRNSKTIGATTQKITPTMEISTRVKEEVVELLKKGGSDLKNALDDLLPLESQLPTFSSNKRKEHPDMKLLE